MSKDNFEYVEGGILRDRYGRREMVSKTLHQALASGDALEGGTVVDADKREQVVIVGASSSSGSLPAGWISVKDAPYNAKGDGATDDLAALSAAAAFVKANGGVMYFPPGTYMCSGRINLDSNSKAFCVRGPGGGAQYQSSSATIVYTGADNTLGTGGLMTFNSANGWELCYLGLDYNNASFTGHLVQIDGGIHASDSQDWHIHHCTSRARSSNTASSIVRMHKTVIGTINNCHWTGAANALRFSDSGGATSYVVAVQVEKCTFNFCTDADIRYFSGDGEMLSVIDCTFEAGINTTAIKGDTSCKFYKFVCTRCWFGDASATVIWIDGLVNQSNGHVGTISDNAFFLSGTINDVAFKMGASDASNNCGDWLVIGNTILGSGNAFDSYTPTAFRKVYAIGNTYMSLTNVWKSGTAYPDRYVSLANFGEPDTIDRIGLTGGTNVEAATTQTVRLMLANQSGAGTNTFPALPTSRSAVYSHFGTSFVPRLVLQGGPDAGSEVVIGAGASPVKTLWVKDAKIGFYDTTPVVRPSAYTQTYATAARTHNNVTSTAVGTTASTTVTPFGYTTQAQADAIPVAINAVAADLLNLKQLVNSVIDDLQANGLLQ